MSDQRQLDYTVKEVAFFARKAEITIRRSVSEGTIKSIKVGGSRRILHEEMVRYLCRDPFDDPGEK